MLELDELLMHFVYVSIHDVAVASFEQKEWSLLYKMKKSEQSKVRAKIFKNILISVGGSSAKTSRPSKNTRESKKGKKVGHFDRMAASSDLARVLEQTLNPLYAKEGTTPSYFHHHS